MTNLLKKSFILFASLFALIGCGHSSDSGEQDEKTPSIEISATEISLEVYSSVRLSYELINYSGEVVWSSSDTTIVTVDQDGLVYASKVGEAIVNVRCDTLVNSCLVKVTETSYAPAIYTDAKDEFSILKEDTYEFDLYAIYKGERVDNAEFNFEFLDNSSLVSYRYSNYRLALTASVSAGSTTLKVFGEVLGVALVKTFVINVI